MTVRKTALITSTAIALMAAPVLAASSDYTFDASKTLAGSSDMVTVIGATVGDEVVTNDGVLLGTIETFQMNDDGQANVLVDLEADLLFEGDTMDLTISPAYVSVLDGAVVLGASEEQLFDARGAVGGQVKVDFDGTY
ncbi:MAG: hypothetical protein AAF214_07095 [Pseudomonadota bacterium]